MLIAGAELELPVIKPYFIHPCNSEWKIYTFIDPPHCVKLVRNIWGAKRILHSSDGIVDFKYMEALYEVQQKINFKIATKIGIQHIKFENKIMNVKRATQLLSSSAADALQFCNSLGIL